MADLADRHCVVCEGVVDAITRTQIESALAGLTGWKLTADGTAIVRRFEFKNFARAMQAANLAGWIGESEGHHPDVRFGWGYCEVQFSTHSANGVTENDLICAARMNRITG